MKKLIAVFVSLSAAVLASAAPDFPKMGENQSVTLQQQVNSQVDLANRVVTLKAWIADTPQEEVTGQAIVLGFNEDLTRVELLLHPSLATDFDIYEEVPTWIGILADGVFANTKASAITWHGGQHINGHYNSYKISLPVALTRDQKLKAEKIKKISAKEAAQLMQIR